MPRVMPPTISLSHHAKSHATYYIIITSCQESCHLLYHQCHLTLTSCQESCHLLYHYHIMPRVMPPAISLSHHAKSCHLPYHYHNVPSPNTKHLVCTDTKNISANLISQSNLGVHDFNKFFMNQTKYSTNPNPNPEYSHACVY